MFTYELGGLADHLPTLGLAVELLEYVALSEVGAMHAGRQLPLKEAAALDPASGLGY